MPKDRPSDGPDFRPVVNDHLLSRKKPNTKSIRIALDSDIADQYDEAKVRFDQAETSVKFRPEAEGVLEELDQAKEALATARELLLGNSVEFSFKSIGRRRYEDLLLEHRPTTEQQKKAKAEGTGEYNFNPDTFPPALIAASLVRPSLTEEMVVKEIWDNDDWNTSETLTLFTCAMEANSGRRIVDFPKGSGRTYSSG